MSANIPQIVGELIDVTTQGWNLKPGRYVGVAPGYREHLLDPLY